MKIRKTKAGTYTTQIAIRDADGKLHSKRFTRKTKKELQSIVYEYQTAQRVYTDSKAFEDCMRRLIDEKEKVLSPSTIRGYRNIQKGLLKNYRAFCRLPVDQIGKDAIQHLANDLRLTRKAKTVSNYIGMVSNVLTANGCPMPSITIKKDKERFEPHVPTAEVVAKVAAAAKGTRYELPFALACLGMRRGEICAITSDDFVKGNQVHIRHAIAVGYGGEITEKETKTDESDRYLLLPDAVADLLREKGRGYDGSPASLTAGFWHFLKGVDVEHFRLHDCRHFFASYCHDVLKLSDAQIQKLGGWKTDYVMKRVYITTITDETQKVSDALGEILK